MAWDINRVVIVGRMTDEPLLQSTRGGTAILNFSVACGQKPDQNGNAAADFFNVTAWGKTAENINRFCRKGHLLCIDGRLRQERWNDRDGNKRQKVIIVADRVEFLAAAKNSSGNNNNGDYYNEGGGRGNVGQSPSEMPDSHGDDFAPF